MKAELRKEQILQCAKKIFAARGGYYETHIEEIIKEAKIGKGTFYQYFNNKEELFVAVLQTFLDEWEVHVTRNLSASQKSDPVENIRIFVMGTFEFFQKNQYLCNIYLCNGPGLNPVFEPSINQYEDRMLGYIVQFIEAAIASGVIRKDIDIEIAANIFLGAFLRLAYYHFVLKRKKNTARQLEKLAEGFFDIAMRGIKI
jgi:AcrR family transcriptional regulator